MRFRLSNVPGLSAIFLCRVLFLILREKMEDEKTETFVEERGEESISTKDDETSNKRTKLKKRIISLLDSRGPMDSKDICI